MSDSTDQGDPNGDSANNAPIGQIMEIPRREIFFQRGRRREGGRLERMGFVLGVALQALLPESTASTGHAQRGSPLEPVEERMETDNHPVVAREEPVEARVDPEDAMEADEGRGPVVEPDHEMEEIEEARGNDDVVDELDLEAEEPEAVPVEAPTPLRSCLKRSSPEKEDGVSPKRRKLSFSRAVAVQHHERVLANNLNRPYVMTGQPTDTGIERLSRPSDRTKPQRVTEEEVVELLEASGGPETLPTVGNPPTHRGCTCGEVCDENCSCLQLGIKCSNHYGCMCLPGKCGTGRPTAAANARLYVPGRAVSATEEYDRMEAKADSTISSVDDDNLFGDSASGSASGSAGGTTMVLDQTTDGVDAGMSNADLDVSFVGDDENENDDEDLDASFVARDEVEEEGEEPSLEDLDASVIQAESSTSANSEKAILGGYGDDDEDDLDASFVEDSEDINVLDQVSAQSPPPDVEYEADEVEVEDVVDEEDISAKDVGIQTRQLIPVDSPTLLERVSSLFGSIFSRSPPPAAAQHDEDDGAKGQSIEGQVEVEDVKNEVEDSSSGRVEDEDAIDQDVQVDEDDIPIHQFVSFATLDTPSHLVPSPLEEIEADDAEDDVPAAPLPAVNPASSDGSSSSCVDLDDGLDASPGCQSPARVPASPPGSPSSSSSSSDSDSSDDDADPQLPFDSRPEQFPPRLLDVLPLLVDQREINSCLPNAWLGGIALFVGLLKTATEFNRRNAGTGRRCGVLYHTIFVDALELVEQDLAAGNGRGGRNRRQAAAPNELNPTRVAQGIVYGNSWSELLIPLNIKNQHWAIAVVKRNTVQAVILDSLAEPTTSPEKELRKEQDEKVKMALKKILVAVGSIDPNDKTTHRFKARHTFRKLRCIQEDGFNCGIFAMVHGRRVLERLSFNGATRAGKDADLDLDEERRELKADLEATKAFFTNLARQNGRLVHGPGGSLPITASKTPVILRWSGKC